MEPSQILNKVAECLYRNGHGVYFAIVKVNGKQIKRSLKTDDSALAKRRFSRTSHEKAKVAIGTGKGDVFFELAWRRDGLRLKSQICGQGLSSVWKGLRGRLGSFLTVCL